ncbi:MAG: fibronectin type III domain-containing protein [Phycisphaerae bacterium]
MRSKTWIVLLWLPGLAIAATSPPAAQAKEDIAPISDKEKLAVGKFSEQWVLASETSAVIYWQTENRSIGHVEYGRTKACRQKTTASGVSPVTGLPYWTHLHRITGLEPGTEYFFRMVCVGTDGKESRSETATLRTKKLADVLRIPEALPGAPYVLDRKDATYVMTKDLTLPLGGLEIRAAGITLDMDGHTLVYNDKDAARPAEWSERAYKSEGHDFGINVTARGHVRIVNGVIRQGRGNTAGTAVGIGCNPLYSRGASVEMAGVEVVWSGRDVSGLFLHWTGGSHIHHCVMEDTGSEITNRHQAISTIDGNVWGNYDHNLVRRTRQQALTGAAKALHNEIYVDSCATNAFGIVGSAKSPGPVEIAHNRIIGIGQHPVGIAMFKAYKPGTAVHHNLVEVKCTRSGTEYGYTGSACFRTTWGADNLDVHDNTFIAHADVYGGKVAKARAVWVGLPKFTPKGAKEEIADARGIFRGNYIAALGRKGAKAGGICVVCLNESPNLIFLDNTVVSTWGNVLLGDEYGHSGGYPKFVGNTFRRAGKQKDYCTIRHEYSGRPGTGVFLANQYEDGAGPGSVRLQKGGRLVFQSLLKVEVEDRAGKPLGAARVWFPDELGRDNYPRETATEKSAAMLVATGEGLQVVRPIDRGKPGFVDAIELAPGTAAVVLTREVVTEEGRDKTPKYRVRVQTVVRVVTEAVDLSRTSTVRVRVGGR